MKISTTSILWAFAFICCICFLPGCKETGSIKPGMTKLPLLTVFVAYSFFSTPYNQRRKTNILIVSDDWDQEHSLAQLKNLNLKILK